MASAVILVSGGLDSATVLALAQNEGFTCHGVTFEYGQRHRIELESAAAVCQAGGAASHRIIQLDPRPFSGSALTDGGDVPRDRTPEAMTEGIPDTYVPARNLVFLSCALGVAEGLGAHDLFLGVNAIDYSGYPDCRREFIESFEHTANLATRAGVEGASIRVHVPLIEMTKAEIIRLGTDLGVDYSLTVSCYDPGQDGSPCGSCDACQLRARGFSEAEIEDPITRRCS